MADTHTTERHPTQWIALITGIVFTLVGLAGFAVTGFDGFAHHDTDERLLGFELNPLHNVVHLVIGVAGLALWRRLDLARTFAWLLFVGYGATFLFGVLVDKGDEANFLSLNPADDGLHLASAAIGLLAAMWPARDVMRHRHASPARG